jgi:5-methylcytosine-specific restriction protein B
LEVGFEFGFRVVYEAGRFVTVLQAMNPEAAYDQMLDHVVIQKILPRLHGSRRRLEPILCRLASICYGNSQEVEDFDPLSNDIKPSEARLNLSFDKLRRMTLRIRADHFASFAE